MKGTVVASGSAALLGQYVYGAISFPFTMSAAPTARFITLEATPPPECPGSRANPEARPGFLCVFEVVRFSSSNSIGSRRIVDPAASDPTRTASFGAILQVTASGDSNISVTATWAATAP